MGRRTLLVIASVLIAAVGTALIWVYVQGADARARRAWQEPISVLVATDTIEPGATRDTIARRVTSQNVPRTVAPKQPLTTIAQIGARVASVPILAGQYLIEGQFSASNGASAVPDGRMGLVVQMEDPNRAASLLRPASHVAVYAAVPGRTGPYVRLLLDDVTVIAVGGSTTLRAAGGGQARVGTQAEVSTALVTLDVDNDQALELMAYRGYLYFTLLGKGAKGGPKQEFQATFPSASAGA